ncbi:MAG: AraC family transcriptional regulator [Eubacteriales bacterium]|nr:AraC family transcriptional regulator [Eubacteriales bacterium]
MPNIHLQDFSGPVLQIMRKPVLRCAGRCSDVPGYSIKSHSHPTVELLYIVEGEGSTRVGGNAYPLAPGYLAVYNPNVEHAETFSVGAKTPYFYHIKFDEFSISGLPVGCLLPSGMDPTFPTGSGGKDFEALLHMLFHESADKRLGYEQVTQGLLQCVVVLTLRQIDSRYVALRKDKSDSLVVQIQQYLYDNYAKPLSMKDVAEEFHLNYYYFSHLFKKALDVSPSRYLADLRISEACRLLSNTKLTINQIAEQVGYGNQSNFQVQFKRSKGVSPMQYRAYYTENPLIFQEDRYE